MVKEILNIVWLIGIWFNHLFAIDHLTPWAHLAVEFVAPAKVLTAVVRHTLIDIALSVGVLHISKFQHIGLRVGNLVCDVHFAWLVSIFTFACFCSDHDDTIGAGRTLKQ